MTILLIEYRPLAKMDELQLMVKLMACARGGHYPGFNEAKLELINRGCKVAIEFTGPGAPA